jgi:NAD(P)-dependent dehydrogenase (short-subunit alcohol dehydrogenase family)
VLFGSILTPGGGAKFSVSAPSAFAKRGLAQSLAREFGPKGIHVAHVVIDGLINTDRVKGMMGEAKEEGTVSPLALDPGRYVKAHMSQRLQPDEIAEVRI